MRLAEFILGNIEPILAEWEVFARSIWPREGASGLELRDHAESLLRAAVRDMNSQQSAAEQSDKSKGGDIGGTASFKVDDAAKEHASARALSGFDPMALVSEYRALRASVIRLWRESDPHPDANDLRDITRFNESIDQSLAESIRRLTENIDQSREMFLGILGHDLRNPLGAILLSAQVLAEMNEDNAANRAVAAQIASSGDAMARMLADFLVFTSSRLSLGRGIPVARSAMDLDALCREVIAECKAGVPGRNLRLESHGNLQGEWDPERLRQLLSNLVGNAVQHGTADGPVTLSARGGADSVVLTIHNDGIPIPKELLPGIFDPLVQDLSANRKGARRPGSMGLGLYIAREIVSAHGGTIAVESEASSGTTFRIALPRATA